MNLPLTTVLIDASGSTNVCFNNISIFQHQHLKINNILKKKGIDNYDLIYWSNEVKYIDNVKTNAIINDYINPFSGGTYLNKGINAIQIDNIRNNDIYIITDGEIQDNIKDLKLSILNLLSKSSNINIFIITIEANNNKYIDGKCDAGNRLYKCIKELQLTHKIRSFESFNRYHYDTPFISFNNPILEPGFIPFGNSVFHITKLDKFMNDLVITISNTHNHDKIKFDLSTTIYYLCNNKTDKMKEDIINMFCKLFPNDKNIYQVLSTEVLNHDNHCSSSYFEYINNRVKLFEKANNNLNKCVKSALKTETFVTILLNNYIYQIPNCMVNETVQLGLEEYMNGGIKINDSIIPVLPVLNFDNTDEFTRQCTRQYIRAIYARQYLKNPSDEIILYIFLTHSTLIQMANLSDEQKNIFKNLSLIMLDKKRFGTGIKEIEFLKQGSFPKQIILEECIKIFNLGIKPYTLWYAIINSLGNIQITSTQLRYCINHIIDDKLDYTNLIINVDRIEYIIINGKIPDYDFYCYETNKSTKNTGGYLIPQHNICENKCSANYIMSQIIPMCPLCHTELDKNDFIKIYPKKYYEKTIKNENIKNKFNHEELCIENICNISNNNLKNLYELENINFKVWSYSFDIPIFSKKMKNVKVINNTMEKYQIACNVKYNFLQKVNMNNVCIAGGFNRSILLGQDVNDIDLFFYGLNKEQIKNKLRTLVNELIQQISEQYPNYTCITLYKQNSNVYEILCLDNKINYKEDLITNARKNKIILKIQIILKEYFDIQNILNSFDLWASCVAYDVSTNKVYFNEKGKFAYKYMINIVDETMYSELYDMRLQKYFSYGFDIVMPEININKIQKNMIFQKSIFDLDITNINKNILYVNNYSLNNKQNKSYNKGLYQGLYQGLYNSKTFSNLLGYINDQKIKFNIYDGTILEVFVDSNNKNKHNKIDWYKNYRKAQTIKIDKHETMPVNYPIYKIDNGIINKYYINNIQNFVKSYYSYFNFPIICLNNLTHTIEQIENDKNKEGVYYSVDTNIKIYVKENVKENISGWIYGETSVEKNKIQEIDIFYFKKN